MTRQLQNANAPYRYGYRSYLLHSVHSCLVHQSYDNTANAVKPSCIFQSRTPSNATLRNCRVSNTKFGFAAAGKYGLLPYYATHIDDRFQIRYLEHLKCLSYTNNTLSLRKFVRKQMTHSITLPPSSPRRQVGCYISEENPAISTK